MISTSKLSYKIPPEPSYKLGMQVKLAIIRCHSGVMKVVRVIGNHHTILERLGADLSMSGLAHNIIKKNQLHTKLCEKNVRTECLRSISENNCNWER